MLRRLAAGQAADAKDAARYRWAKPILNGDDDPVTDVRVTALADGLLSGKGIDEIIDAAIAASQPGEGNDNG